MRTKVKIQLNHGEDWCNLPPRFKIIKLWFSHQIILFYLSFGIEIVLINKFNCVLPLKICMADMWDRFGNFLDNLLIQYEMTQK